MEGCTQHSSSNSATAAAAVGGGGGGNDIVYAVIEPEDSDEVDELLITQFFKYEPLGVILKSDPETQVRPWIAKITGPMIRQGVSTENKYVVPSYRDA